MKAAVYENKKELVIKEVPKPQIANDDDVLLKVKIAGICGSDLHYLKSEGFGRETKEPRILGHEFVSEIVGIGKKVKYLKVGDIVTINNNVPCGFCKYCRMGIKDMCTNMRYLGFAEDGGFAEYAVAPAEALFPLPKSLSLEAGVLTEPLSCVVNALSKVNIVPSMSAVVLGGGPIGQLYVRLLRFRGAGKIILSELSSYRAEFGEKSGADKVVNPITSDIIKETKSEVSQGVDLVIDTVGDLFGTALKLVCSRGNIILFGIAKDFKGESNISQMDIMNREITIKGSVISDYTFPIAIRLLEQNALKNIEEMISHKLPLSQINEGIELARKGEANKVAIYL